MDHRHNKYAFLDGIRGMAAIFVLTRHTADFWHIQFYRSYLAVDLFFILSGFVIAYAYDEKLSTGNLSVTKFFLIRLIRLYPVYLLSLFLCSLILIAKLIHHHLGLRYEDALSMITLSAMFLPSRTEGSQYLFTVNPPYWSLFFELIANAVYATIRPWLTDFALMVILFLSGLILIVASFKNGNLDIGFNWGALSILVGFSRSIFGIFFGLMLYRHRLAISSLLERKIYISPWIVFFLIAIILSSPSVAFEHFNAIIDVLSVTIIFPIAILIASQGTITNLSKFLIILGSASYPIYVLHQPVGEILFYLSKGSVGTYAPVSGIILVVVLIVLSIWVEKWYDIPVRSWLTNIAFRRNREA